METRELDSALRHICKSGAVPGLVAMATNENELIYQGAFGKRDISGDQPMTQDSVFWIASMTKALTAAAAMQLVERGKLSLDGPLGELLPELAAPNVLEGFDADGAPQLRPAKTALTLRHLLTHTSGFCYDMWNAGMVTYLKTTGTPGIISCKNAALTAPLVFDPGTRWEYGIGIDVVGKVVEAASGQRLGEYLRKNLLGPLGMDDTGFRLGDAQRSRLVAMHHREADGSLTSMPFEIEQNPEFEMGGGGLYGTAQDYLKFTRMILNKGRAGTEQLLQTATVEMMAQNQMGDHMVTKLTSAIQGGVRHQRRRSLSRHGEKVEFGFSHQLRKDAGGAQPRQPGVGGARQHLLLDRSRSKYFRRDPDAGAAFRRRKVSRRLHDVRARNLSAP